MQRYFIFALTLAMMVGCGKNNKNPSSEEFTRLASNFHLRLQKQYFEPSSAPTGVVIKLSDAPKSNLEGNQGTVTFTQAETTNEIDRDVRVTLTFTMGAKQWELVKGEAVVIAKAKRGKLKEPVATEAPIDALADEVYGPRIQAAMADTPQY